MGSSETWNKIIFPFAPAVVQQYFLQMMITCPLFKSAWIVWVFFQPTYDFISFSLY